MKTQNVKVKTKLDVKELIAYFGNITDGLKNGTVTIQQGEERVYISPTDNMSFEIQAEDKKDRSKLNIELSFKKRSQPKHSNLQIISDKKELAGKTGVA